MAGEANTLYYGDNLRILRDYVPDESVDLVYLDPPFNSSASYNILFKERGGQESAAQIKAFEDTWHWGEESERAYAEIMESPLAPDMAKEMVASLRRALGDKNDMTAYLAMIAVRLLELHRVLKLTGSIYLHCDPTAGPYLRVLMNAVFGPQNLVNEIVWKRSSAHSDTAQGSKHFGRLHDILLFYGKSKDIVWNQAYGSLDEGYVNRMYRYVDTDGRKYRLDNLTGPGGAAKGNPQYEFLGVIRYWRYSRERMQALYEAGRIVQTKPGRVPAYKRYLDEMPGRPVQDIWDDIPPVSSAAKERLGYPTQKPLALLERIIQASSNAGDVVLDPFCGCGTAVAAAHKLDRHWLGIDVTHLAVALMKSRLKDMFGLEPAYRAPKDGGLPPNQYLVIGEPEDVEGARQLAKEDRYQFQYWAVSLATGQPRQADKKGADQGVDGVIFFVDGPQRATHKAIIQVKSGHVTSAQVRDLKGVLERERAALGLFITLEEPTRDMKAEAASGGFFHSDLMQRDYPKVQLRTIAELLEGRGFELPLRPAQFKPAQRVKRQEGVQGPLEVD